MKKGKSEDKSFESEQEALEAAKTISYEKSDRRYVIKCEEQYFVSTTDNVQKYETLIASFRSGVRLQPQTP
jgi:predicted DNA-binding WGR domain protein